MVRLTIHYIHQSVKEIRAVNIKTKHIVMAALMAALTCVATMIIKIPSPLNGYINLGDCIVLVSGWLLLPAWGFFAAGFGAALADILSGYAIYAPATFLIKGCMALAAFYGFQFLCNKCNKLISRILCGIIAEAIMVLGYFIFEGFLYGFGPAAVNIPANLVQGSAGIIISIVLMKLFDKSKLV